MKSWCKKLLTAGLIFMTAVAAVKTPMPVYADEVSGNSVITVEGHHALIQGVEKLQGKSD